MARPALVAEGDHILIQSLPSTQLLLELDENIANVMYHGISVALPWLAERHRNGQMMVSLTWTLPLLPTSSFVDVPELGSVNDLLSPRVPDLAPKTQLMLTAVVSSHLALVH